MLTGKTTEINRLIITRSVKKKGQKSIFISTRQIKLCQLISFTSAASKIFISKIITKILFILEKIPSCVFVSLKKD